MLVHLNNFLSLVMKLISIKNVSNRYIVFALIPMLVLTTYATIFGIGELLVHALAIGQYTLLALLLWHTPSATLCLLEHLVQKLLISVCRLRKTTLLAVVLLLLPLY